MLRLSRFGYPVFIVLGALMWNGVGLADEQPEEGAFETTQSTLTRGFFDFYWDDNTGKVWLKVDDFDKPFLYVSSLATGLGSNPVGLDRGQLGSSRVVLFRRVGPRVFLVQPNLKYRAVTDNAMERKAIQDSFAESILWSGKIEKNSSGESCVDLTEFLLRDAHDCIGTLARTDQGTYSLDKTRCHVYLPRTKSFPKNTEFEVSLTFSSNKPGRLAQRTAADGKSITLRQHHSLIQLPEDGYRPRRFDPRMGCFAVGYADYGQPIDQPIDQRLITRHRLEKADPSAVRSPAKEPIVYYVDPGVPEPVRQALVDGAAWWNEAFEEAGFIDAFQVRILPDDADPMDVRFNVIQWVHRATRGWSYGQSIVDPRTGEILKGHVLLGSLRVRQDHLLFEGLDTANLNSLSTCGMTHVADEAHLAQLDPQFSSVDVALARIRQLSAHEVGHTLGFAHNFAASTYADRASVMDYPAPRTKIVDGRIDLSDAYGVGIGDWDKLTVKYAYSQFDGNEAEALDAIVADALQEKMLYVTDADARPAGAAHPAGNLWDNGSDPVEALAHEMRVRKIALDSFDASGLSDRQPLSELEKSFVPLYLHHRYQVDATAKLLGGNYYTYAIKGDGQKPLSPVDTATQRKALHVLLTTLDPENLVIPQHVLDLMPPKTGSSASDRERFSSQTQPLFDPTSAIRAAAELTLANILEPHRASRIARNSDPTWRLEQVLAEIESEILSSSRVESDASTEARRIVQHTYVDHLIVLAEHERATLDARLVANAQLVALHQQFDQRANQLVGIEAASLRELHHMIDRFLNRRGPAAFEQERPELPPGSPIGNR